jgi:hypothetical protein
LFVVVDDLFNNEVEPLFSERGVKFCFFGQSAQTFNLTGFACRV